MPTEVLIKFLLVGGAVGIGLGVESDSEVPSVPVILVILVVVDGGAVTLPVWVTPGDGESVGGVEVMSSLHHQMCQHVHTYYLYWGEHEQVYS